MWNEILGSSTIWYIVGSGPESRRDLIDDVYSRKVPSGQDVERKTGTHNLVRARYLFLCYIHILIGPKVQREGR